MPPINIIKPATQYQAGLWNPVGDARVRNNIYLLSDYDFTITVYNKFSKSINDIINDKLLNSSLSRMTGKRDQIIKIYTKVTLYNDHKTYEFGIARKKLNNKYIYFVYSELSQNSDKIDIFYNEHYYSIVSFMRILYKLVEFNLDSNSNKVKNLKRLINNSNLNSMLSDELLLKTFIIKYHNELVNLQLLINRLRNTLYSNLTTTNKMNYNLEHSGVTVTRQRY